MPYVIYGRAGDFTSSPLASLDTLELAMQLLSKLDNYAQRRPAFGPTWHGYPQASAYRQALDIWSKFHPFGTASSGWVTYFYEVEE